MGGFDERKTWSRTEAVLRRLEEALAAGTFPAGTELPSERTLVRVLDSNRTAVREAQVRLVERGVLEAKHRRLFVVQLPQSARELGLPKSPRQLARLCLGARRALWASLCALAVRRRREVELATVSSAYSELRLMLSPEIPPVTIWGLYVKLGAALGRASGNPVLAAADGPVFSPLRQQASLWRALVELRRDSTHSLLVDLLQSGPGAQARAFVRRRLRAFDRTWLELAFPRPAHELETAATNPKARSESASMTAP